MTTAERTEKIYSSYSGFYDLIFDSILQPGRERAVAALDLRPGDRVLEVGVGTGLSLPLYPRDAEITGIDIAARMLDRAERRVLEHGLQNVALLRMEVERMTFPDASFDKVLASYVMSVVPDPARAMRELTRVCAPGGSIVLLNHFRSRSRALAWAESALTPLTRKLGFSLDLPLERVLVGPVSMEGVEKVNAPPCWSLVRLRRAP